MSSTQRPMGADDGLSGTAVARTIADLRARVAAWRAAGETVALVPTMGALHEGHLTLTRTAAKRCDRVVVSIFVNPLQFGPNEDFEAYPRREESDRAKLSAEGVDLLYAPLVEEMYKPGFATTISVAGVTEGLCGAARPGHFDGVATVVTKLLLQSQADRAFFGEKDYQQLMTIKRLAIDLDIPTAIEGVPTVRDAHGLALSSRNAYLDEGQLQTARSLNKVLRDIAARTGDDPDAIEAAVEDGRRALLDAGFEKIDYLEVRDAETLAPLSRLDRPARVLVAAHLGRARLIDNWPIQPNS